MTETQPIKYVDASTRFSRILPTEDKIIRIRHNEDTVGVFSTLEDNTKFFFRWEIDRNSGIKDIKDEFGTPLFGVLLDKLRTSKSINIVDAGCGTGRALYNIRQQLILRSGTSESQIECVGINLEDYSDESEIPDVRNANKNREISYIVSDLETVSLPEKSTDVIYSFEAFIYNNPEKIKRIVKNLLPSLKNDGFLIFNMKEKQRESEILEDFFTNDRQNGFTVYEYPTTFGKIKRTFALIRPYFEKAEN